MKSLVKLILSIGTGNPGINEINTKALRIHATLAKIATETEDTEKGFIERWTEHFIQDRFFRFNVQQGLQKVGLEEYEKEAMIMAATNQYLDHTDCVVRMRKCVNNLVQKQSVYIEDFS